VQSQCVQLGALGGCTGDALSVLVCGGGYVVVGWRFGVEVWERGLIAVRFGRCAGVQVRVDVPQSRGLNEHPEEV